MTVLIPSSSDFPSHIHKYAFSSTMSPQLLINVVPVSIARIYETSQSLLFSSHFASRPIFEGVLVGRSAELFAFPQ